PAAERSGIASQRRGGQLHGALARPRTPAAVRQPRATPSVRVRLSSVPLGGRKSLIQLVEREGLEPAGRMRRISNLLSYFEFPIPSGAKAAAPCPSGGE